MALNKSGARGSVRDFLTQIGALPYRGLAGSDSDDCWFLGLHVVTRHAISDCRRPQFTVGDRRPLGFKRSRVQGGSHRRGIGYPLNGGEGITGYVSHPDLTVAVGDSSSGFGAGSDWIGLSVGPASICRGS